MPRSLEDREILVPVSLAQATAAIQQVTESGTPGGSLVRVLLALGGLDKLGMRELAQDERFHDPKLSQTVVISLMILGRFHDREAHHVKDLARSVELADSTLVRYLRTWLVIGVLEQLPDRRYRLAREWRKLLSAKVSRGGVVSDAS